MSGANFPASWPPGVPREVEQVIARALEKNPAHRYASLQDLITALEKIQKPSHGDTNPPNPSWSFRLKELLQAWARKPRRIGFALILLIGLLGLVVLSTIWMPCVTTSSNGVASACKFNSWGQIRPLITSPSAESGLPTFTASGYPVFSSPRSGSLKLFSIQARTIKAFPNTAQSWAPAAWGNYVYFVSNRSGKSQIYFMNIFTAEVTPVFQNLAAYDNWSPAPGLGRYLYYVSNEGGKAEIYYLDAVGNRRPLTDTRGDGSSWSPAPSFTGTVYFVSDRDGKAGIYYVDRQKGVRLTPDNQESWGPVPGLFGTLYYTSNVSGKAEIYKRNWLGQITQVTFTPDPYETWTGSRNGKLSSSQP